MTRRTWRGFCQTDEAGIKTWFTGSHDAMNALPARTGDRMWVREPHTRFDRGTCDAHVWYAAGANDPRDYPAKIAGVTEGPWPLPDGPAGGAPYRVSLIALPRWASRLTLLVTDVRVERLQALTDDDAKAEGLEWVAPTYGISGMAETWSASPREAFRALWNSIHGYAAWPENPFVTVVTFRTIRANIDAPEAQEQAA